jgi:hypothetical protein
MAAQFTRAARAIALWIRRRRRRSQRKNTSARSSSVRRRAISDARSWLRSADAIQGCEIGVATR